MPTRTPSIAILSSTTSKLRAAGAALLLATLAGSTSSCGGSLTAPFDQMKGARMTVYRLQNYEAPAAQAAAGGGFQLPPQIQQSAQALLQMLPPGLLPPGIVPGTTPAPAADANAPRFHNFRILAYQEVAGVTEREGLAELFGKESNFQAPKDSCMYPEYGIAMAQANGQPADILVSLSCNTVQTFNFAWPYPSKTALTSDSTKKFATIVQKVFTP
jgi:hypothetical protein